EEGVLFIEDLLQTQLSPFFKKSHYYVLSGPSFADELAQGDRTQVHLAGYNKKKLNRLKELIETKTFKVTPSADVKGVAFAGAVKNVIAILGGVTKGLNLPQNSQTALILRGTEEIMKIGESLGVKKETYLGPAYFGDVILSLSQSSRNSRLGLAMGKGDGEIFLALQPRSSLEGANTIKELYKHTRGKKDYQLINRLYNILYKGKSPKLILKAF
ncbi:MAG: hypothetical protein OXN83_01400, partial [Oligoflexia bacterium]|nr:hypothetical protein [Oligoflexia bacterium]